MKRIKELRKQNKITQKELAKLFHIANSTLSYWEKGKFDPNKKQIIELADYFNVSTDYLLGRTDDPTPPTGEPLGHLQAFRRDEFEGLTPEEVDHLAAIAATFKKQRGGEDR